MTFVALAQSHFLSFMTQRNGWLSCHTKVEDEYGPHWGGGAAGGRVVWCSGSHRGMWHSTEGGREVEWMHIGTGA